MKKETADILKYEIHWQIVRTSVKGKGDVDEKIGKVYEFFQNKPTYENWGRCVNWIEGLARGYKASSQFGPIERCYEWLEKFGDGSNLEHEVFNEDQQFIEACNYSFEERYTLWKDLFKYEKDFTSRRYRHKELERLVDLLYKVFMQKKEYDKIKDNYKFNKILEFRVNYKNGKNKKNFFF